MWNASRQKQQIASADNNSGSTPIVPIHVTIVKETFLMQISRELRLKMPSITLVYYGFRGSCYIETEILSICYVCICFSLRIVVNYWIFLHEYI